MAQIFLSHAKQDKPAVRRIAAALRAAGHEPWGDDEILIGESIPSALERARAKADYVVLCISQAATSWPWARDIKERTLMAELASDALRLLPLRLEDVDLPGSIAHRKSVDLFPERAFALGVAALIDAIETYEARRRSADKPDATAAMPRPEIDGQTRKLGHALDDALERQRTLIEAGHPTAEVDREIREFKSALRRGGQVHAGSRLASGRYVLLRKLGRGGFATVWEALDRDEDEHVAIKVLHGELAGEPVRRERFFRGARAMTRLNHEGIVRVRTAYGEDDGYHDFVMDMMHGGDLHRAVLDGQIDRGSVIPLILRIGEALAEAHAAGLVHRDVKPGNILLTGSGEPRLGDFDLVTAGADSTGGTRTQGGLGTAVYAAPELLERPTEADARADIYGLAMTAVFALHGYKLQLTTMMGSGRLAFVRGLDCIEQVAEVLVRGIALNPEERFEDMHGFCEALNRAASATNVDKPEKPPRTNPAPVRPMAEGRARRWPIPAGVAATITLVGVLYGVWPGEHADHSRQGATPIDATPIDATPVDAPQAVAEAGRGIALKGLDIQFVSLPGGTFTMGSPSNEKDRDEDEIQHEIAVSPFFLSETEVTQKQWETVMGTNPSYFKDRPSAEKLPVENISWFDAIRFLNKLSEREGLNLCYTIVGTRVTWDRGCDGYRLPTEAEWEYACRAGSEKAYSFGYDEATLKEYAHCGNGPEGNSLAVKSLKPNQWGLHDIHGNVWEWVWDWYAPYSKTAVKDPMGPKDMDAPKVFLNEPARSLRGGAFHDKARFLRCAFRGRYWPSVRFQVIGLRIARSASVQP